MRSFTVVARIGENRIDLDDIGDGTQGIKGPGAILFGTLFAGTLWRLFEVCVVADGALGFVGGV